MKRTLFALAVLIVLAVAGFVMWPRQSKAWPQSAAPLTTATTTVDSTPTPRLEAVSSAPGTIVPPLMTPSAIKNAEGHVTREIADLGDGRGPVDRRFKYNADGQIAGEIRLDPATGQLIENVEYLRTNDGKVLTRITDAKGNIVFPALIEPVTKAN